MAIKKTIKANGIEITDAYTKPVYLAINFKDGAAAINLEVAKEKGIKEGMNIKGPEVKFTKEEIEEIQKLCYNALNRTEMLKDGIKE